MNSKKYRQLRAISVFFVSMVVAMAVLMDSYILACTGVITGMVFLVFVRSQAKFTLDEREQTIREKAAQLTYAIFAPTIGIGAFLLLFPSYSGLSVFSRGEFVYLESLGMVFAYLTLFLLVIYAISYFFLNKKYGGSPDEK